MTHRRKSTTGAEYGKVMKNLISNQNNLMMLLIRNGLSCFGETSALWILVKFMSYLEKEVE